MGRISNFIDNIVGCVIDRTQPEAENTDQKNYLDKAIYVKGEVSNLLKDRQEIQGIGISPAKNGYSVNVDLKSPLPKEVATTLPRNIEGVPINTKVVGSVVAFV